MRECRVSNWVRSDTIISGKSLYLILQHPRQNRLNKAEIYRSHSNLCVLALQTEIVNKSALVWVWSNVKLSICRAHIQTIFIEKRFRRVAKKSPFKPFSIQRQSEWKKSSDKAMEQKRRNKDGKRKIEFFSENKMDKS